MAIELIVNILLILASIFCFGYVGSTMPKSAINELGAEQWPQALLIVLLIALAWNVRNYFKRNKKEEIAEAFRQFPSAVAGFFKSKLFIGMILLVVMAVLYEPIGFITTCLLFLISYGILLGRRKIVSLIISSVIITLLLYVGFSVFLGVMLPRGQVGFLREIALFLEAIVQRVKG